MAKCFLCNNDPSGECAFCRLKKSAQNFYGKAEEAVAETYQTMRGALSGGDYRPVPVGMNAGQRQAYRSSLGFGKGYIGADRKYNTSSRNTGGGSYPGN